MNTLETLGVASLAFVAVFTWTQATHADQGGGQTKRESMIEAWANIVVGFSINYCFNLIVLPLVGAHVSLLDNFWLGWIFTTISILRQYALRRWFNKRIHSLAVLAARRKTHG